MNGKGSRNERKLRDWFLERGWFAQRAGASGGGGDQALPDVMAMQDWSGIDGGSFALAIELKSWSTGKGQIRKEENQISQLREVADRSGAIPAIVVWPDMRKSEHDGRYFIPIDSLKENECSYSVTDRELDRVDLLCEVVDRMEYDVRSSDGKEVIWPFEGV